VSIGWTIAGEERGRKLELEWRESGGPPVTPAARKGFGTQLLTRVFDYESSGGIVLQYEPSGLLCVFRLSLSAQDEAEGTNEQELA